MTTTPVAPVEVSGSALSIPSVDWRDEAVLVAVATASWAGAELSPPWCRPPMLVLVGVALVAIGLSLATRRRSGGRPFLAVALVLGGAFLVAGHRGVHTGDGYRPLPSGPLPSPVRVLGDPEPIGVVGWRIEVRLPSGDRVEAVAHGRAGAEVSGLRVGQSAAVRGRIRPVGDRPWLRTRHIVAQASIDSVEVVGSPALWRVAVEAIRDRIGAGGAVLDERPRALYRGLVLGDDRFQPPGQTLQFRLAGLSHLLAVSGQNVAFVLASLAPITGRLPSRGRLGALLLVLIVFALITRLEPSVLRAVATAGLSAWAAASGRSRSGVGVLAAAVIALVLIDPFLVDSVGFQLSVVASAGILVLSPALTRRLPGPGWLVSPLATGLGAQMAVAPLLGLYFGPVSLVTVPANLAAGWAAAATMVWGMTIGPVAGLLPDGVAGVVQLPVAFCLWWLETAAALGARAPDPRPGLTIIGALLVATLLARVLPARWPLGLVAAAAAIAAVLTVPQPPERPSRCGREIVWYPPAIDPAVGPTPSVLVIGEGAGPDGVEDCRLLGVRAVDLVVIEVGDRGAGRTVAALAEVVAVGELWAAGQHSVIGARRRLERAALPVAGGSLTIVPDGSGRRLVTTFDP